MADKFRKTIPLKITFTDGELPEPEKLSALSNQVRNGTDLLEKAMGDLWNQSGDADLNKYPLQIPNLARTLGEAKYMNPAWVPIADTDLLYEQRLGEDFNGLNSGYLK